MSEYVLDEDGEPIKKCCFESLPHNCGDCWGGTERDPYLDGENMFDPVFNAALRRK